MSQARRFVAGLLAGCPAKDTLMTCVSELCANAISHTASGDGGVFIVEVDARRDGVARIAVTDEGADGVPAAGSLDLMAEGGRGLAMVAACTTRWGFADAYPGRTVWAEASWPVAVPPQGQSPHHPGRTPNSTPNRDLDRAPDRDLDRDLHGDLDRRPARPRPARSRRFRLAPPPDSGGAA